jgi:hypothetical protein
MLQRVVLSGDSKRMVRNQKAEDEPNDLRPYPRKSPENKVLAVSPHRAVGFESLGRLQRRKPQPHDDVRERRTA